MIESSSAKLAIECAPRPMRRAIVEPQGLPLRIAEGADQDDSQPGLGVTFCRGRGRPEARLASVSARGLHGSRVNDAGGDERRPPLRYVLPAGTLN
jgi:hypothetical protein